jgi:hypothetical protein
MVVDDWLSEIYRLGFSFLFGYVWRFRRGFSVWLWYSTLIAGLVRRKILTPNRTVRVWLARRYLSFDARRSRNNFLAVAATARVVLGFGSGTVRKARVLGRRGLAQAKILRIRDDRRVGCGTVLRLSVLRLEAGGVL